jgi:hypothetical protein
MLSVGRRYLPAGERGSGGATGAGDGAGDGAGECKSVAAEASNESAQNRLLTFSL